MIYMLRGHAVESGGRLIEKQHRWPSKAGGKVETAAHTT